MVISIIRLSSCHSHGVYLYSSTPSLIHCVRSFIPITINSALLSSAKMLT